MADFDTPRAMSGFDLRPDMPVTRFANRAAPG